ncbi:MAG: hypothetical protein V1758_07175, partial [Pseudomonadota bacterium]
MKKSIEKNGFENPYEPQNVEQRISNVEVNPSSFCGSLFDIRHFVILGRSNQTQKTASVRIGSGRKKGW